jgi:glycosyltransferase involved in cell wall biosynthesis
MSEPTSPPPTPDVDGRVVWIVNQYAGSPAHGMEYRHYELGRELTKQGMTVVIVSGSYSHLFVHQPRATGAYTLEDIDGLTYCWVGVPHYRGAASIRRVINMLAFMWRLYRLPARLLRRPDVIVVSSPSPFPILPAERWRRRFGCPLVFEVRDIWPMSLQELVGLSDRHPLVLLLGSLESRAYRAADVVVSVLPDAGPHFVRRGMAPGKLRVIPNGIDAGTLEASQTAQVRDGEVAPATSRHRPFIVGYVGTLGIANTIETLIDAARLLQDDGVAIRIVGQGPHEPVLRQLAAGLNNVRFVGPVAKSDVQATMRGLDAGYVGFHRSPLYRLGIAPNKLVGYMAAERPVLLAADAANDLVRDAGCGLTVEPDDPRALADAILRLRDMDPEERARLGRNGREFVARELTYRTLGAEYAALLAEVME